MIPPIPPTTPPTNTPTGVCVSEECFAAVLEMDDDSVAVRVADKAVVKTGIIDSELDDAIVPSISVLYNG